MDSSSMRKIGFEEGFPEKVQVQEVETHLGWAHMVRAPNGVLVVIDPAQLHSGRFRIYAIPCGVPVIPYPQSLALNGDGSILAILTNNGVMFWSREIKGHVSLRAYFTPDELGRASLEIIGRQIGVTCAPAGKAADGLTDGPAGELARALASKHVAINSSTGRVVNLDWRKRQTR